MRGKCEAPFAPGAAILRCAWVVRHGAEGASWGRMTFLQLQTWIEKRGVAELRIVRGPGGVWHATAWRDGPAATTATGPTIGQAVSALTVLIGAPS